MAYRRGQLKLTQDELAQRTGLGIATIQRIELGERVPQAKTLAKLEPGLEWPLGTAGVVLDGGDPPSAVDPQAVFEGHPAPVEVGDYLRDLRAKLGSEQFFRLIDEFTRTREGLSRTDEHGESHSKRPDEVG